MFSFSFLWVYIPAPCYPPIWIFTPVALVLVFGQEKGDGTKEPKRILLEGPRLTWLKNLEECWWLVLIFRYFNQENLGVKWRGKSPFLLISVTVFQSASLLWVDGFLGVKWEALWRLYFSPHTPSSRTRSPASDRSARRPRYENSHLCTHCVLWELTTPGSGESDKHTHVVSYRFPSW